MKKTISFFLAMCVLVGCVPCAFAGISNSRVVIGADLTDEQINQVYSVFQVEKGMVPQLIMSNAVERQYLEGIVDAASIGTRSVSCVYIELQEEGSGLDIKTNNITLSPDMFRNSLETAGIKDARIIVAAPFEVSGTAALAGIYWAYESMAGEKIGESEKQVSTEELAVAGDLAREVGTESAENIVVGLKDMISVAEQALSDDDVSAEISRLAGQYGISLSENQISRLLALFKKMKDLDETELMEKVKDVEGTLNKVSEVKEKTANVIQNIKNVIIKISDFIEKIKTFLEK